MLPILLTSCIIAPSIQPFYTSENVVFDEDLLGKWVDAEEGSYFIFREYKGDDGPAYTVEFIDEEGKSGLFRAYLFKLKDQHYLDFSPEYREEDSWFYAVHLIPAHSVMQCHLDGDKLALVLFNHEWIIENLPSGQVEGLRYEETDDLIILTSATPELQKFVMTNVDRLFDIEGDDTARLVRVDMDTSEPVRE
jgi:hypothetical protein